MTLTAERLRELLHYDPETGVFTRRISTNSRAQRGDIAGCPNGEGYIYIGVDARVYRAHRLAWLYMTGEWPSHQIDHKDLVKSNNRWENLRQATVSENQANRAPQSKKYPSPKGARWHKRDKCWQAGITVAGRHISLGYFQTAEEAHAAYVAASREYFGEFARPS